jgi:hypothetical protein
MAFLKLQLINLFFSYLLIKILLILSTFNSSITIPILIKSFLIIDNNNSNPFLLINSCPAPISLSIK